MARAQEQAYYMKKGLDSEQLRDALKHASNMLLEFRTDKLAPENYFTLCKIFALIIRHDCLRRAHILGELFH